MTSTSIIFFLIAVPIFMLILACNRALGEQFAAAEEISDRSRSAGR